ncbi:cytochrome P450 [Cristinia sonorae]|uniref:Cytochrome P450 n=1 Tax=Cristinia sonorae TaxID=1940300 RepID=A0A8K0XMD2_9AGAR|nr:cytochrome P450 [Cristinia sonorae]
MHPDDMARELLSRFPPMPTISMIAVLDFIVHEPNLLLLLTLFLTVYYVVNSRSRRARLGKPLPMPRGLPIIGNAHQLGRMPWLQMTEWSKKLGPIYALNLGGKLFIVLNSHKVAADILDKKSAVFSGRPRMIMPSETLCGNHFFPFLTYGDTWRKFRKAAYEILGPRPAENFTNFQEREARILVETLSKDSENWSDHLHRAIASGTLALSYAGPPIKDKHDSVVTRIDNFMHRLEQSARPGEYLVEIFPWMNHLPKFLTPWKREGEKSHEQDTTLFKTLFHQARDQNSGFCATTVLAPKIESGEVTEKEAAWLSGTLFGAGSSTTSAVQHVFILAMVLHPHVMHKAQAEIDAVVGRHRMPNAGDRLNLPYCRALMRETFRWRAIGPLGVPHYIGQDEEYEGYHLPADSVVFYNVWAMNHDSNVHGDPENFRPERFLDETETTENIPINTHGEGHTAYGYGRRKCIGSIVANSTLLINIATLLWAFDIVKAKDSKGKEVTPDPNDFHDEGLVVVPSPFPCRFVPRDPDHLPGILARAREAATTISDH